MKLITDKNTNGLTSKEFTEFLKTPTLYSSFTKEEAEELEQTLKKGLETYPGLGISATQFGDDVSGMELFLLNPIIKERSKDGFLFYEGCLSIPKTVTSPLRTIRSTKVIVQTDNLGELTFEINPEGDKANDRVSAETMMTVTVQHEIDHLDGITIKDRIYSTTRTVRKNYGRNDLVVMKSPAGEMIEVKYKNSNKFFLQGYEVV
jgi:peptide deformylase